jgi:hypothetical protein
MYINLKYEEFRLMKQVLTVYMFMEYISFCMLYLAVPLFHTVIYFV